MAHLIMSTALNGGMTQQFVSTGTSTKFSIQLVGEGSVDIEATNDPALLDGSGTAGAWWFVKGLDYDPEKGGEITHIEVIATHIRYTITDGTPQVHISTV